PERTARGPGERSGRPERRNLAGVDRDGPVRWEVVSVSTSRNRMVVMTASAYVPETFPRQWLPREAELKTWEQIEPWYRQLLDRPIGSAAELEEWLVAVGELKGAV